MRKFAALIAATSVAASKDSAVNKVVTLLGELKSKVQNDLENEGKSMKEYEEFCDDEITEKGFAIKTASADIERFNAVIDESSAKIEEFASVVAAAGSESAKKNGELAKAREVRGAEKSDFKAAEKELVEAVDMLSRAAVVLKRGLSLMQGKNKMKDVVSALQAIVNASWVDQRSAAKVQAFLESEDEFSLHQPQAASYNYESKSGGIVETIEDMRSKAQENLQKLRRDETQARHSFEMLQQSLEDALSNLNKETAAAQSSKGQTEEVKGNAEQDLSRTEKAKAADAKYKAKLEGECASKASEWSARQKSAADELAALDKAKEILSGGVKVFAQVGERKVSVRAVSFENRDKVASLLRKMGRKFSSFGLMQIATAATNDPFTKVRGMIEGMISKLEDQAAEEATHDAFCKEETAKSIKSRETKTATVEKYQTRLDKGHAAVAALKQQIAALQGQVGDIDKAQADATRLRTEEKADNTKAAKDFKDSAEAVTQAIEVLREYYGAGTGSTAFVQAGPELGDASNDSAHGIVAILETAQSDFSRLLAETETAESEAQAAYETLTQDNKVSKAAKQASIKGKTSEQKAVEMAIQNNSSDLETASKELDAVMDYLAKLRPQCESKAMTYEERKSRRDDEIAGLKEALEILSGDAVLLQKTAFLARSRK